MILITIIKIIKEKIITLNKRGGVPQVLGGELLHHGPGAAAGPARGYP